MHDSIILIISNNNEHIDIISKSIASLGNFDIKSTSLLESINFLEHCYFDIIILDEDLEYNSTFVTILKNLEKNCFFIGIVKDVNKNIFLDFKDINIFGFIEIPINQNKLKDLFHSVLALESKRHELKRAGLYEYLTQPISQENIDNVISIVYEYMTKPITKENLEKAVANVYTYITTPITKSDIEQMLKRIFYKLETFRSNSCDEFDTFLRNNDELIGKSKSLNEIKELIAKVAPTNTTVLILGESGTGKELVARSIFKKSLRKDKHYLTINCAAISPSLIEAELFGYEKGAFTGAVTSKKGIIEEADNGTLFLDEIGDMDFNSQAKLLRVLEYGELRRVGGTKTINVNVRFIAATNQDLREYVEQGRFRKDLYYRLMSFPIFIKPLRERKEDIEILSKFFIYKFLLENKHLKKEISNETIELLKKYDFPGNVRELKNIIERAIILSKDYIKPEHLPPEIRNIQSISQNNNKNYLSLNELLKSGILNIEEFEKALIITALNKTGWNRNEATKLLGIGRTTLYEKMKKYNFEEPKNTI